MVLVCWNVLLWIDVISGGYVFLWVRLEFRTFCWIDVVFGEVFCEFF
ncbi:hypothetical protein Hdeb2414_s0012g00381291 [Helianthus debilis subsp. tardiflorus]